MTTEKKYSERELVSFARYILSGARKETVHKGHSQFLIYDSDLKNWKEECKNPTENKIVSTKNYNISVTTDNEGKQQMNRQNDGFNPIELIGLSDFIAWEVREQMMGKIVPDTIKRQVVVDQTQTAFSTISDNGGGMTIGGLRVQIYQTT